MTPSREKSTFLIMNSTLRRFEMSTERNDKIRGVIADYIRVREMSFGDSHAKNKSEALNAFSKIKKSLDAAGISHRVLDSAVYTKNTTEALSELKKTHREITGHEDLCETYIGMKQSAVKTDRAKEHAKRKLLDKIAAFDPMLSRFVLYKVTVDHARRTLAEFLVNETPESLEERYKDLLGGLF